MISLVGVMHVTQMNRWLKVMNVSSAKRVKFKTRIKAIVEYHLNKVFVYLPLFAHWLKLCGRCFMNKKRKSSCVNARGIATSAYQVLHLLSCTRGYPLLGGLPPPGVPCWGHPLLGVPLPGIPQGTPIWTW